MRFLNIQNICICGAELLCPVVYTIASMDTAVLYKHSSTHCSSYSARRLADHWESGRQPSLFLLKNTELGSLSKKTHFSDFLWRK